MTDPTARPPTDSEERATLLWAVRTATAALVRASAAMATHGAFLLEARAARDTLAWLDGHDGLQIALGEARGTASASESLDKTQNSEQGALRASLDDLLACIDAEGHGDGCSAYSLMTFDAEKCDCFKHAAAVVRDALKAPLTSSETAPPAPDLLRENARLREEVERLKRDLACAHTDRGTLKHELTRARAAHLENATLLAKANTETTRLRFERDAAHLREDSALQFAKRILGDGPNLMEVIRRAAALNTTTGERVAALEKALRELFVVWDERPRNFEKAQLKADTLTRMIAELRAALADRKGNAPKAPLEPAADPGRVEGKKP